MYEVPREQLESEEMMEKWDQLEPPDHLAPLEPLERSDNEDNQVM